MVIEVLDLRTTAGNILSEENIYSVYKILSGVINCLLDIPCCWIRT